MKKYLFLFLSLTLISVGVAYAAPNAFIGGDSNLNSQAIEIKHIKSFGLGFGQPLGDFEAATEIADYHPGSKMLYSTNSYNSPATVDRYDLSDVNNPTLIESVNVGMGGVTSVAIFENLLAAAVPSATVTNNGYLKIYNIADDGALTLAKSLRVGVLPDMVTFSPDGNMILTANEGQPNDSYTIDPEGSVSIIDISKGVASATVTTANFRAFNSNPSSIRKSVPTATLAQEVEPEYIAVSADSKKAYVSLQENNAIAVIDLTTKKVIGMWDLGLKDYRYNCMDLSDKETNIDSSIRFKTKCANVMSMYQPDAIQAYEVDGHTYIVTANEGDSRDYDGYSEEVRVADLTLDKAAYPKPLTTVLDTQLGRLKTSKEEGDFDGDGDVDQIIGYGGRSFSIYTAGGIQVFDSRNEFSRITMADGTYQDDRSDDKGCEPEGLGIEEISGSTYAFITLERCSVIMVYDISDPKNPVFQQAVSSDGDVSPETVVIIKAEDSPNGETLLIGTNEYSGTIAIYQINNK
jgi:hypothetical protein